MYNFLFLDILCEIYLTDFLRGRENDAIFKFKLVKLKRKKKVKVSQLCPTLWDPMDYTVHGILQARIQEWVAFPFSRETSQPRDQTQVSRIEGGFFTSWGTRKAQEYWSG